MCLCRMVADKECVSIRILPAVSLSVFPLSFSRTSALPVIHPVCGKRQQSKDQKDGDDGALGPVGAWKTLISAPSTLADGVCTMRLLTPAGCSHSQP